MRLVIILLMLAGLSTLVWATPEQTAIETCLTNTLQSQSPRPALTEGMIQECLRVGDRAVVAAPSCLTMTNAKRYCVTNGLVSQEMR